MEIEIKLDHVYLYMLIPPKYALSMVIETTGRIPTDPSSESYLLSKGLLEQEVYLGEKLFYLNCRNQ